MNRPGDKFDIFQIKLVSSEYRLLNSWKDRGFVRIGGPGAIFEKQTCAIDDKSLGWWSLAHVGHVFTFCGAL